MPFPGTFHRIQFSVFFLFFFCLVIFPDSIGATDTNGTVTLDMKKLLVEYMKFPEKVKVIEGILEQDASATELMQPILLFGQVGSGTQTASPSLKAKPQEDSEKQIKNLVDFMGKTFQKRLELLEKFKEKLLDNIQTAIQKVGKKHQNPIIINTSPLTSREVEQILLSGLGSASFSMPGNFSPPGMQSQPPNGFLPPTMMGRGGPNSPGGMPNMRGPFGFEVSEKKTDLSFFSQSVIFSTAPDLTEEVLAVLKEEK